MPRPFYVSEDWKQCRQTYLQNVDWLCERCAAAGDTVAADVVHHKVYLTDQNINDRNITLNHDLLLALCHDCHNKEHKRREGSGRYKYAGDGSLIHTPPISDKIFQNSQTEPPR